MDKEVPAMAATDPTVLFVGDLDDPWVLGIAEALPDDAARLSCPGDLPDVWPIAAATARTLVLHRGFLTEADAERIERLTAPPGPSPRVVLCVGPHARYRDQQRWVPLVEAILPEATAAETVSRHLADRAGRRTPAGAIRPCVTVVSGNHGLREVMVEACWDAGYPAEPARDWDEAPTSGLAVWDVPILEDGWNEELERRARSHAVLALLGFADRALVGWARAAGAAACLDVPCDPADLAFVLDRLAADVPASRRVIDVGHEVPPPPTGLVRASRAVAEPARGA
jgi:hypothetical protein